MTYLFNKTFHLPFETSHECVLVSPSCHNEKLHSRFPFRILRKAGSFPVVYHYNAALFLRSSTVITGDYCPGDHLPSINKAEERWRQVATLTPTVRFDVEESRFRSVGATVGLAGPGQALREYHKGIARARDTRTLPGRNKRERSLIVCDRQSRSHNQYLG